jgi:hypothetical protein
MSGADTKPPGEEEIAESSYAADGIGLYSKNYAASHRDVTQ